MINFSESNVIEMGLHVKEEPSAEKPDTNL